MYRKTDLKNGLRVVTHDIKNRDSISIGIWIGVGGRYEQDRVKGAAHFLEHIVFKGTQKYNCEQIKELIEGVGGSLNAFTSEEQTCFYAKIPSQFLNKTFDILADMVLFPKISQRDVTKEKAVIVEELKMYRDLPQYFVLELLDALVWPGHPLGKHLAGTPETVMGLSFSDLKFFHKNYYSLHNIVISACGKLNHQTIVNLVRRKFGKMSSLTDISYIKVKEVQDKPRVHFFRKKIEQMHLAIGMLGYDEYHKDRYGLTLLSIILGGNMSSRLFVEIREKRGLAYSISSSSKTLHDTGLFLIRAGVDNQKIVNTVKVILKELSKIKNYAIDKNEFKRAKDYLLGQLLLGLEDTMEHMLWIGETVIAKNRTQTRNNIIKEFEKITVFDLKRIARYVFNENHYNLALVGPVTDEQEKQLKNLLKIKR